MPIVFNCPACSKEIRVSETAAGRSGTCNHCNERVVVPSDSASTQRESRVTTALQWILSNRVATAGLSLGLLSLCISSYALWVIVDAIKVGSERDARQQDEIANLNSNVYEGMTAIKDGLTVLRDASNETSQTIRKHDYLIKRELDLRMSLIEKAAEIDAKVSKYVNR